MNARERNRRVSIMRAPTIDDGFAETRGAHVEIGQRWAKKTDASDGERIRAEAQGEKITARFNLRWDELTATIGGTDLIFCEGTTYEVTASKEIGRVREAVEITAAAIK